MLNLDHPTRGLRDCPKCRFSMVYLKSSSALNRQEGYILDKTPEVHPYLHSKSDALFLLISEIWHSLIAPIFGKIISDRRNRKYEEIVRLFPHSLICTHCNHIIRQR